MDDDKLRLLVCYLILLAIRRRRDRSTKRIDRRRGRVWVSEFIQARNERGAFLNVLPFLDIGEGRNRGSWNNYLRMDERLFNIILEKVRPKITKADTTYRRSLPAELKLVLTLRFLATGSSYASLYYDYRVSASAICKFVPDVCTAIYEALKYDYLRMPSTPAEWKSIANQFSAKWNFPNCIGAMDGKHVVMMKPWNAGSHFHNYKGTESIVLMALVDADYKFIYVSVGANGRVSDGGVFDSCGLSRALSESTLGVPAPESLPDSDTVTPYVIVGDEAFPMKPYLMRPYARKDLQYERKIFNYRLSRARRTVENAFGIMASQWRVFHSKIALQPRSAEKVVLATCVLHNFLRTHGRQATGATNDNPIETGTTEHHAGLGDLGNVGNRHSHDANLIRERFCRYFMEEGALEFQERMVQ